MQVLHYLPTVDELALPSGTAAKVVENLIEPFGKLDNAKRYWQEYPCPLVCLNRRDKVASAIASLDGFMKHFVELADTTPEFIEPLPHGYQLSLTIINDEGNGLYLIKPTDMNLAEGNTNG